MAEIQMIRQIKSTLFNLEQEEMRFRQELELATGDNDIKRLQKNLNENLKKQIVFHKKYNGL